MQLYLFFSYSLLHSCTTGRAARFSQINLDIVLSWIVAYYVRKDSLSLTYTSVCGPLASKQVAIEANFDIAL